MMLSPSQRNVLAVVGASLAATLSLAGVLAGAALVAVALWEPP